jgi:hypothetical protein
VQKEQAGKTVPGGELLKEFIKDRLDHFGGFFFGNADVTRGARGHESASVGIASGDFQIDEV